MYHDPVSNAKLAIEVVARVFSCFSSKSTSQQMRHQLSPFRVLLTSLLIRPLDGRQMTSLTHRNSLHKQLSKNGWTSSHIDIDITEFFWRNGYHKGTEVMTHPPYCTLQRLLRHHSPILLNVIPNAPPHPLIKIHDRFIPQPRLRLIT